MRGARFHIVPVLPAIREWLIAGAGIAGFVVSAWGFVYKPVLAWSTFLVSSFFFLTVSLGAVVLLSVMYLSNASWPISLNRVPACLAAYLPIGAFSILLLQGGTMWLYPWAHPGQGALDTPAKAKPPYLNVDSFAIRMIAVLALWVVFEILLRRDALQRNSDAMWRRRRVALAGIFLALFPFSFSMASVDWLMSLDHPQEFAKIFGLYHVAGLLSAAVAAVSAGVIILSRKGTIEIAGNHLRRLRKLMLGCSIAWACVWLGQFLLILCTACPGNSADYTERLTGDLAPYFFRAILNLAIPFVLLWRRTSKRADLTLLTASVLILAARWFDIHLLVALAVTPDNPWIGILDVAVFLGLGTAFFFTADRAFAKVPVGLKKDQHSFAPVN